MKILLTTITLTILTTASGYSKPGGWLFDLLDRSSISVSSGSAPVYYSAPAPVYYYQQPVYYQSVPVVSRGGDVYVCPPPTYYRQPAYNNSTRIIYQGTGYR